MSDENHGIAASNSGKKMVEVNIPTSVTNIAYSNGSLIISYSDGRVDTIQLGPVFTQEEKAKLASIEPSAQRNQS